MVEKKSSTYVPRNSKFVLYIIIFFAFMPLFPSVAGGSQLHVNVIIAIVIPVILLISTKRKLSSASLYVVVLIFSTSQMLILISSLFGKEQVSVLDIQSILRPTFMMALVISFLSVLYEDACRDID